MIFKPRDYQQTIMQFIAEHERCNVWSGMGTGKSVSTLTALEGLAMVTDPYPALIIAPLRVASSTWPGEVQKWGHLHGLRVGTAVGEAGHRIATIGSGHDVVTINYDNLVWLVDKLAEQGRL